MEKVKTLKPNTSEFDILSSGCTVNHLILNFDANKYTIENLLDSFREVTSVSLFEDSSERPFGEYPYVRFFNVTEYSSGTIEIRMEIIKGEEREALELQDKIESLENSQSDQDDALIEIGDAIFS